MKTFIQYCHERKNPQIRETTETPNDLLDHAPLIVTVNDLIAALQETEFEEDRKIAVRLDDPVYDSITVYFYAQGEEPGY